MTGRLHDQRGFTLIEVLIASILSLFVLGVTLTVVVSMSRSSQQNREHNAAQDAARLYTDRLARQLRNLASPSIFTDDYQAQPFAVDLATGYDFVFRVVDETRAAGSLNEANVKRVRYCLDTSDPARGRLHQQEQTWADRASNDPPPVPSTASCPGTGWTKSAIVTGEVVNRTGGRDRPMFVFNSADVQRISQVHTDIYVDPTPGRSPVESHLASGVTLRNQNRVPSAAMTLTVTNPVQRHVILNGSGSEDPEGMPLSYQWYLDPPAALPDCTLSPRPASCLGDGVVIEADMPAGSHRVVLVVKDPAGLPATAEDRRTY